MLLVFDIFSVWEAGILKTTYSYLWILKSVFQAEFKITPEDAL